MYATKAGATPKATMSARLSSCSPNELCELVSRATRPSIPSKAIETKIKNAAFT